jgi:ABC-type glycerol-3-phosphate transport system permease component
MYVFPFIWMISVSLQTEEEMRLAQGFFGSLIPPSWRFGNYAEVFKIIPFARYFINSATVTGLALIGTLVSSTLVAYAFSRLTFPGRKLMISIMLGTMVMPHFIFIIPLFKMYSFFGFINTYVPLVLPAFLGGGAGSIYLIMQFFKTIPLDFSDAAKLDGAGHLRIWYNIMIPLCKPVVASVAIFTFLFTWNDFMTPLIYISREDLMTVALGLNAFKGRTGIQWGYLMSASLMSMIPVLVVFIFCHRYFVEGIKMSGIKA